MCMLGAYMPLCMPGPNPSLHFHVPQPPPSGSHLPCRWENALYLAAGTDPYELVDKAVAAAAKLSGTSKARQDKALPEVVDVFGWCTWDAYYSKVSARGEVALALLRGARGYLLPRRGGSGSHMGCPQ